MSKIINNIGKLRGELIRNNWHMTAFPFIFKQDHYDVLFENNDNLGIRINPYASVTLHFVDAEDITRTYTIEANQVRLFFNPREFRAYFGIEYSENLGDVFKQFFERFLTFVPPTIPKHLNQRQDAAIDRCLASRGGHNPEAIYCYDARRLGVRDNRQMLRSIFIANLTARRYPTLYKYFEHEKTVTFYFSPNPEDELREEEIIHKFTLREESRRN